MASDPLLMGGFTRLPVSPEHGQKLHRYWTNACRNCPLKSRCTPGRQRRITRWEHEDVLEACRSDSTKIRTPCARGARLPFGTMERRMGATHFLTKTPARLEAIKE